jgi:type III secretory pathway component EscS
METQEVTTAKVSQFLGLSLALFQPTCIFQHPTETRVYFFCLILAWAVLNLTLTWTHNKIETYVNEFLLLLPKAATNCLPWKVW